jgi:hypothetical protein
MRTAAAAAATVIVKRGHHSTRTRPGHMGGRDQSRPRRCSLLSSFFCPLCLALMRAAKEVALPLGATKASDIKCAPSAQPPRWTRKKKKDTTAGFLTCWLE